MPVRRGPRANLNVIIQEHDLKRCHKENTCKCARASSSASTRSSSADTSSTGMTSVGTSVVFRGWCILTTPRTMCANFRGTNATGSGLHYPPSHACKNALRPRRPSRPALFAVSCHGSAPRPTATPARSSPGAEACLQGRAIEADLGAITHQASALAGRRLAAGTAGWRKASERFKHSMCVNE